MHDRVISMNQEQLQQTLEKVKQAVAENKLSASASENMRAWLTEPRYAAYANEVAAHIAAGKWQVLDDVFWTVIPFGTGGRRGKMYPIGSNAINDRTIGESAQGLADYVKETLGAGAQLSCAIGHDTRHKSDHFAKLCTEIMTAAGFKVYLLKGYRATPELSFTVREKKCSCGIMVTASHNPPSDNAVKVYWSTGGQILPPHDKRIIERVMNTQEIRRADFDKMLAAGKIVKCQEEIDKKFQAAVMTQASRTAEAQDHLLATPWRWRNMRDPGAQGRWLCRCGTIRTTRETGRRLSECAGTRGQSGKPRGV